MTTQTKTFIEPSDIVGLKIECGGCHSNVTIPIDRKISFKGMGHCQNCGEAWLVAGPTTKEKEIALCIEVITATVDTLQGWQETLKRLQGKGFSLAFELARPTEERT